MAGYCYDAGMLIALDRNDRRAWRIHREMRGRNARPTVPAPVLAQVWRGGPAPNLSRALKGCVIVEFANEDAKPVGELCASTATSDVVDAHVAHIARHGAGVIFSSDQDEIRALIQAGGHAAEVISV
jgi:hypothetical protein